MTFLWVFLSGVMAGSVGYLVGRRERPPLTLQKARQALHFRVAVHEAGHAVVGWRAPKIRILSIQMDEGLGLGNGRVMSATSRNTRDFVQDRWWDAAFSLGGLAAELLETKKARSGNCLSDVNMAKAAARDVVDAGNLLPPWSPVETDVGAFDPTRTFKEGTLTEGEAQVLRLAYAHARAILLRDRETFSQLTHALLEHGSLDEASVQKLLY